MFELTGRMATGKSPTTLPLLITRIVRIETPSSEDRQEPLQNRRVLGGLAALRADFNSDESGARVGNGSLDLLQGGRQDPPICSPTRKAGSVPLDKWRPQAPLWRWEKDFVLGHGGTVYFFPPPNRRVSFSPAKRRRPRATLDTRPIGKSWRDRAWRMAKDIGGACAPICAAAPTRTQPPGLAVLLRRFPKDLRNDLKKITPPPATGY